MRTIGILLATAVAAFFMFCLFERCGQQHLSELEKTGRLITATEYLKCSNWGWGAVWIVLTLGGLALIPRKDE